MYELNFIRQSFKNFLISSVWTNLTEYFFMLNFPAYAKFKSTEAGIRVG